MKHAMRSFLFVVVAALITFGAIVYQRATGPTYPMKVEITIDGQVYPFKLIRSHGGNSDCRLEFEIPDTEVTGKLTFRKFPTNEEWTTVELERQYNKLVGFLPHQPPAGKLEYRVEFQKGSATYHLHESQATVIRFKGDVPAAVLIPHVILMFVAMFLSNLAGVMALFKHRRFRLFARLTLALLFLGGMVMGPWVQWYAFGEAWAGVPFAWDLTDNKTLVAFIFWVIAVWSNRKKERPAWVIVAFLVMLAVYSIPHSMYGSQLDPESGKIIQGWIQLPAHRFLTPLLPL